MERLIGGAPEAAEVLLKGMRGKRVTNLEVSCAKDILDRVLGKPHQSVDVWTRIQSVTSIDELDRLEAQIVTLEATRAIAAPVIDAEPIDAEPVEVKGDVESN